MLFFHEPKSTEQESGQIQPRNFLVAPLTDCQCHSTSASRMLEKPVLISLEIEWLEELKLGWGE